jgi:endonuclease G, mitochondrial
MPKRCSTGGVTPELALAPDGLVVDTDYRYRRGFDETFLGLRVPLPVLDATRAADVAAPADSPDGVLRYHHFSVVMSRSRRFAIYSAANLDGKRRFAQTRAGDRWIVDIRLPDGQVDNHLYAHNDLDRGHLTRRADMLWGDTLAEAVASVADTFHYTNCVPQHRLFNQSELTWQGLEDYLLSVVADRRLRADVYTGPVFAADDPLYRGVRLPRSFWKVVAAGTEESKLHATAYLLAQEDLVEHFEGVVEEPPFGAYRTYQTSVRDIEASTGLDFGELRDHDPYEQGRFVDAPQQGRLPLKGLGDVVI